MTTLSEEFQSTFQAVSTPRARRVMETVDMPEISARALFYGGTAAAFRLLEERYAARNPGSLDAEEAVAAMLAVMEEISAEIVADMGMQTAMLVQLAQEKQDAARARLRSSGGEA